MDMPVETTRNRDDLANVATALSWQARRQPNVTAIHYPVSRRFKKPEYASCTYQELDELSNSYARGLTAYGIGPGTRTALMLTPGLDFFAMFFALFKAGAVPVLIDPGIGMKPLKQCLAEAEPKAFIGVSQHKRVQADFGYIQGLGAAEHVRVDVADPHGFEFNFAPFHCSTAVDEGLCPV